MTDSTTRARAHVLVICARRYNGHELWTLLGVLQKQGCTFEVVSTNLLVKDELTFRPNKLTRLVYDVSPNDLADNFDALCVVSGNMSDTEAYWSDKHVQSLVIHADNTQKIVAAICCSVPTLAPISTHKRVSFFPLIRSRKKLETFGAILQRVSLSVDGRIVTAENQMITEMWAEEIACLLLTPELSPLHSFTDSGFTPKGRERRMPKEVRKVIDAARASRDT